MISRRPRLSASSKVRPLKVCRNCAKAWVGTSARRFTAMSGRGAVGQGVRFLESTATPLDPPLSGGKAGSSPAPPLLLPRPSPDKGRLGGVGEVGRGWGGWEGLGRLGGLWF